jgi:hypothetical protein
VFRKRRFGDLIARQLDLFVQENGALIRECEDAEAAYTRAERDDAEEAYGDYQDLVETGTEILADLRDNFAMTLDETESDAYEAEFNRVVVKRLPRFAVEIENR